MASQRPVYVFVGGVSHTPIFFEDIMLEMAKYGYESAAAAYPTCGDGNMNTRQWDEVIAIQNTVLEFLEKGRDVVLVLHSYGGWPGSRAVKGLDKETRVQLGKSSGIVELVFIAALMLPDNAITTEYSHFPPWLTVLNGQRIPNEKAMPLLFSDMDVHAQRYWLSQCVWHRNDFTSARVPDAPWHLSIPKTYIVTTGDKAAPLDLQFGMLKPVIDVRHDTWAIKSINSSHEPFLSQPARLAQVLLQPRVW